MFICDKWRRGWLSSAPSKFPDRSPFLHHLKKCRVEDNASWQWINVTSGCHTQMTLSWYLLPVFRRVSTKADFSKSGICIGSRCSGFSFQRSYLDATDRETDWRLYGCPELNWEYCGAVAGLYNSCAVSCGRSCVVGVVELSSYSCSQLQFFWDAVYIATRIKKLPSYCCRESSRELFTEAFVERYCEYLSSNEKKVRKISLKLLWNCFETVLKLFCQLQLPNIGLFLNKKCNSGKWFWYSRYLTANSSNHTLAR